MPFFCHNQSDFCNQHAVSRIIDETHLFESHVSHWRKCSLPNYAAAPTKTNFTYNSRYDHFVCHLQFRRKCVCAWKHRCAIGSKTVVYGHVHPRSDRVSLWAAYCFKESNYLQSLQVCAPITLKWKTPKFGRVIIVFQNFQILQHHDVYSYSPKHVIWENQHGTKCAYV